ncbi:MAG: phenylalanine--tRNA ligase subunit beta [Burkholderiales bacterium]
MKFSENWLRSLIDPGLTSEALAELLTMAGLEVEVREPVAPAFSGVVVANVAALERHPSADRLSVCRVDTGTEILQVVCGAPNVRSGMRVACARVGARLPALAVERVQVRGVESSGMLCSARELGLGDDHSGVLELEVQATLGADLREHLDLDDWLFTLKLTPNRGDCLSILGLAREVAALTGKPFRSPEIRTAPTTLSDERTVQLEAGPACPRYCGRVMAAVNPHAQSPGWLRRRLERCGVRPISAIVDVTNYVMLELGQPLHAFDLAQLQGGIHVRLARPGERMKLLDGRDIVLDPAHLVIADEHKAVALAGVMGGEASGVSDTTRAVFLESAYFDPATVAMASRGLEIASDAAHRFERGVDFELARDAIERAAALILEICGGQAGPVTEALGTLPARNAVKLRTERVQRVLGIELGAARIEQILRRLGLGVAPEAGTLEVTAPSYRFDIEIEEDLIEEIARVHGYENIAPTLPVASTPMLPVPERAVPTRAVKRALAARDYFEVVTFSFVGRQLEADFAAAAEPVAVLNPIASQMSVMRSTLLGSLVECVRFNIARKQERIRVFEVATCFERDGAGLRQNERLAGLCYGNAHPEQWSERSREVDFFDVRADLEAVIAPGELRFEAAAHPAFHPGQSARVLLGGEPVGWIGALHPGWQQKYELPATTVGFELVLDAIRARALPVYHPLPRVQPVRRDMALVVDETLSAALLQRAIIDAGRPLVSVATLFDVYAGEGILEGRKSLAFRVLLQDTEKTLTDAEVDAQMQQIVKVLQQKHGAVLRS